MLTLKDLPIGKTATVKTVGGDGSLRQHLLDMGIIPEADVTMVKYAPMGDPVELRIHSYELTLRLADAERIEIENIRDAKMKYHEMMYFSRNFVYAHQSAGSAASQSLIRHDLRGRVSHGEDDTIVHGGNHLFGYQSRTGYADECVSTL